MSCCKEVNVIKERADKIHRMVVSQTLSARIQASLSWLSQQFIEQHTVAIINQSPAAAALITEKDDDGFSPVHYAAKRGDVKVFCISFIMVIVFRIYMHIRSFPLFFQLMAFFTL